jgi:hypothetical protein
MMVVESLSMCRALTLCGWGKMKLATALKMVCYPGEEIVVGDPAEVTRS